MLSDVVSLCHAMQCRHLSAQRRAAADESCALHAAVGEGLQGLLSREEEGGGAGRGGGYGAAAAMFGGRAGASL